jgi:isoquinoline 1-oxidoreductase beta subunit
VPSSVTASDGWRLAPAASGATISTRTSPPLTRSGRADTAAKINGAAQYSLDYHPDGLLVAVVARSPKFGGKVASVDDGAARAVKGVTDVFQIGNGVAVVAGDYWAARKGREALKITWDNSKAETRSSDAIFADYRKLLDKQGHEARKVGKGLEALKGGKGRGKVITADFEFPYLAHAPMEPMNATIEYKPGVSCLITSGSQMPTVDQAVAGAILGLKQDQVKVNTTLTGGSFGRKATPEGDLIAEAAQIARHLNGRAPVKLMWSREDDIRSGKYRPMAVHRMTARVNKGRIEAWGDRTAVQSIMTGTPFLPPGAPDVSAIEGSQDIPYAIPNITVDVTWPTSPVSVLWWRSVGHTHTAFAKEHFLDVLAHDMKVDPLELRRSMLKGEPRLLGVLNLAAEKAGWSTPLPAGKYRGISVHKSFDTYVSEVAEISMKPGGGFQVDRVVCAVDCGIVINPDVVRSQMEGGVGMGLSAVLGEQVTMKDGAPEQNNFFDYPPLKMAQMPKVEVHIVKSAEAPTGVGEPGLPPLGPALANALLSATGKPVTRLPMGQKSNA